MKLERVLLMRPSWRFVLAALIASAPFATHAAARLEVNGRRVMVESRQKAPKMPNNPAAGSGTDRKFDFTPSKRKIH